VDTHVDKTFGMIRSAVACRRCEGHLGHVFDVGPKPTGLRYCMDGLALSFKPATA
jgi:peptide-methionine (R)-S-oxide reductase